jgi:hypothetical protein
MDEDIKAALEAAQMHAVGQDGESICPAPIIVAFLRALPLHRREPSTLASTGYLGMPTNWDLAAAVERVAEIPNKP